MKRLDAQSVSRQQQAAISRVINRKSEHAPQLLDTSTPHLLVKMGDRLGITASVETMTAGFQFKTKLGKIVDLPVVNNADGFIFIKNRLVTASKVDHAEPSHPKSRAIFHEDAFVIGAAMDNTLAHPANRDRFNSFAVRVDHPSDSTHIYLLTTVCALPKGSSAGRFRVR